MFRPLLIATVLFLSLSAAVRACPADSFISPQELASMREHHPDLVVIDARPADEYAQGHLPGAINLPPEAWRTPSTKARQGDSQYIFRTDDGSVDVARYEAMLSGAGITRQTPVVVYGAHAGKAEGSIPAMILDMLGHKQVWFLDGEGAAEWQEAGFSLTQEPAATREPATYEAQLKPGVVWNLDQVLANLGNEQVVFYDTRSKKEFTGENKRDNARGGRIPGAVLCNYEDMLRKEDKTAVSAEEAKSMLSERGITPDKTVVLYCQTATRVSLPYLMLKDLGYNDIRVYDASWHEYGNRGDTPIETDSGVSVGGNAPATQPAE